MHCSFALLRSCACSALLALSSLPASAGQLEAGVGVYYGPAGEARSGSLAAGERILLSVRLESLDLSFGDGMTGVQFGLDIDPRLTVHNAFPTTDAFFPAEVAPREWLLGLSQCKVAPISQYVLMLLEVEIVPGTLNISDLRVGVRDLTQFGERMGYTHCLDIGHFSRLFDAGDVLMNPSAPSIVHFSAAPDVVVQGHPVQLGWDVPDGATVALDGNIVLPSGTVVETPVTTQTHTLSADTGGTPVTSQLTVDVIQTPRVESFTASIFELEPVPKAQFSWEVSGATSVEIDALPGTEHEIGRGLIVIDETTTWTLRASNEWGTTSAVASVLGDLDEWPPLILNFAATPNTFAPFEPITLSWNLFNADSAELLPTPGAIDPESGNVQVSLREDTVLTLMATNANGTSQRSIPVQLKSVLIDEFRIEPSDVFGGFSTQLQWSVQNAESVDISPLPGAVDPAGGTMTLTPTQAGPFTLTATNASGTQSAVQHVNWLSPVGAFVAAPGTVLAGVAFEVELSIEGALSASLLPFPGEISPQSQTLELSIDEATLFQLVLENSAGQTIVEKAIALGPPAILLTPQVPDGQPWFGEPFTLSVAIEAATEATLEPGFGTIDAAGGDFVFTISEPTTITCTASNALGTTTESLNLTPYILDAALSAIPAEPYGGHPYSLTAMISGATSAELTPFGTINPNGGTFQVPLAVVTTHTLSASARGRTIERTLQMAPKAPLIRKFESNPTVPRVGVPFQIVVEMEGATSGLLLPDIGTISGAGGSFEATIQEPTTYELTAYNLVGSTSATLLVTPTGMEVELTASTTTPYGGRPFTLTALLVGAESATLEPIFGSIDPAGGTFEASVSVPTTFTLTGSQGDAQVSDSISIVPKAPAVTLAASSLTPFPDEIVTLSLTIEGADTATLEPGFGAIPPQSATFTTQVPVTTEFTLSASNSTGSSQVTRTVTPKPPRFLSAPAFSLPNIVSGETSVLQWNADHFDELVIEPVGYQTTSWGLGSLEVSPTTTTTYTIRATNTAGITQFSRTLNVVPFRIESFTASQTTIPLGQPVTLQWVVIGDAAVELVGIGAQPLVGSLVVTPTQNVTYVLRASSGATVDQRSLTIYVGTGEAPTVFLSYDRDDIPGTTPPNSPFTFFSVWILARNIVNGMTGYEVSITTPWCDSIIGVSLFPPTSINVGGTAGNYIVGLGACLFETNFPLLELQMLRQSSDCDNQAFMLGGTWPTSFSGVPGYATCTGQLVPLEVGPWLPVSDGIVSIALELEVDVRDEGNELEWSIVSDRTLEALRIYRRVDDGVEQLVHSGESNSQRWLDRDVASGRRFDYELAAVIAGEEHRSARKSVVRDLPGLSARTHLLPNIPNPFNPSTQLRFALAVPGIARLTIHDLSGRSVWTHQTGSLPVGEHSLTWTGIDDSGRAVASGAYLVRLEGPDGTDTQRIALLK